VPGGTTFLPGQPGQTLDVERAAILIGDALRSPANRVVALAFTRGAAARPTLGNLEILLKQIATVSEFDGLLGLYMVDLQTGQEIHFGMDNKTAVSVEPDIAFSASSTIKIPIVLSYFINRGSDLDEQTARDMSRVLGQSDNSATDRILERIEPNLGPLLVTQDMERLGLQNTFIIGFFYPGAPQLAPDKRTPSNQRLDVFADPDPYSQTTPSEMGTLLSDIYQCAQTGGGALIAAYPEKLTAEACQQVIDFMAQDKLGSLLQGGVPDGTLVPHKHGYVPGSDGIVHDTSDVGIVYSPGGDFVLSIYTYHPVQNVWDITNPLFINLTQATYNYFNLPVQ
jgi:beta-lactamase class A